MSSSTRRAARTPEEWDELALKEIVPALQAGTTMTAIRASYGTGTTIRRALARVGYDTKGQPLAVKPTKASSGKVLAKRVAERRAAGAAWWRVELETGKRKRELKQLLADNGYEA